MPRPVDLGKRNPACTARWHGTASAYGREHCRCPHAREAHRLEFKRTRERRRPSTRTDATGTARRLQALNAMGWPYPMLGERLVPPVSADQIRQWANHATPKVFIRTERAVKALYRQLADHPGPDPRSRRTAAQKGWHTPAAWNNIDDPNERPFADLTDSPDASPDEELVRRIVAGAKASGLRDVDKAEAFRHLLAAGCPPTRIQSRLRIGSATYQKLLARLGDEQLGVAA